MMTDSRELERCILSHVTNIVVEHRTEQGKHGCYRIFGALHLTSRATQAVSAPFRTAIVVLLNVPVGT